MVARSASALSDLPVGRSAFHQRRARVLALVLGNDPSAATGAAVVTLVLGNEPSAATRAAVVTLMRGNNTPAMDPHQGSCEVCRVPGSGYAYSISMILGSRPKLRRRPVATNPYER
ncbi:MAG: hypothetical protein K0R13_680 [Propionibacteriaceae bacterium]|nr:hypothetical protein [Propionibacteriaceae bacterium]